MSEEEKERLLHCVVIGGGPTGVEFSGELSDFIMRDVRQRYAHVKNYIKVTLIEVCPLFSQLIKFDVDHIVCSYLLYLLHFLYQANEILSSFDVGLRQYATKHLTKVFFEHFPLLDGRGFPCRKLY